MATSARIGVRSRVAFPHEQRWPGGEEWFPSLAWTTMSKDNRRG